MSRRSKGKLSFLELEALPPDLRDLSHSCHPRWSMLQPAGRSDVRPLLVWPRSQRSGCIPAEPYPCPVSTSVEEELVLRKLVIVVDREK